MKRLGIILVIILLTASLSGCIGNSHEETQTPPSPSTTSTTGASHTSTSSTERPINDIEGAKSSLESVKQFTYELKTALSMNISLQTSGISQNSSIKLIVLEKGYLDFESKEAWINTTTVSLPDNVSVSLTQVVKGGKTYIKTNLGILNVSNEENPVWEYNAVSLARKYLQQVPLESESGEELKITYILDREDVKGLATPYIAIDNGTGIEVKKGRITFFFRDGSLSEVEIEYILVTRTPIEDPVLGSGEIIQEVEGRSTIKITSFNKKVEVSPPT
ncbi:MAG: hypothetical protein PWQ79_145 [Thermococcaceae archaeon]|nr:hypothetical protein [Thermococcaceae archaeon]MDK2913230.1 hypothetical protein [Thermococcaceae archaeon]